MDVFFVEGKYLNEVHDEWNILFGKIYIYSNKSIHTYTSSHILPYEDISMYTFIHTCLSIHLFIIPTYTHSYMHTKFLQTYINKSRHTDRTMDKHIVLHSVTHMYTTNQTYIHTYIYTRIHTRKYINIIWNRFNNNELTTTSNSPLIRE